MPGSSTSIITGFRRKLVIYRIRAHVLRLGFGEYKSFKIAAKVVKDLFRFKKQFAGEERFTKLVKSGGKYYWQMYLPGFPSKAFDNHVLGGEPMARFEDLLELIGSTKPCTETWISTSGFGIDKERSDAMKKAGLTGVAISLDHFDPQKHNEFRGSSHAYDWAVTATQNCTNSGLLTCWSLCVTRDVISPENLMAYADLAAWM